MWTDNLKTKSSHRRLQDSAVNILHRDADIRVSVIRPPVAGYAPMPVEVVNQIAALVAEPLKS